MRRRSSPRARRKVTVKNGLPWCGKKTRVWLPRYSHETYLLRIFICREAQVMKKHNGEGISRRDFMNGMMIAAGTAAVGGSCPMQMFASGTTFPCDGSAGSDPRVLRGGNLPSVFNIAHWL